VEKQALLQVGKKLQRTADADPTPIKSERDKKNHNDREEIRFEVGSGLNREKSRPKKGARAGRKHPIPGGGLE